jgi:molybdenum cofactor cytidylyltransferase
VGVAAAGSPAAVVVLLGDMPGLGSEVIDRLLDVWESSQPWAAVTEYRHSLGHPLLLSAEAVAEIDTQAGSKTLWRLIEEAPPDAVRRVQLTSARPWDINTMADYLSALRQHRHRHGGSMG